MRSVLIFVLMIFLMSWPVSAQEATTEETVQFLTCPIYRHTDAGRKSGCWLAEDPHTGIRYDVTKSPTKPDWNYGVLVEGMVSDEQDVKACGGVVLSPVRVSQMMEMPCPSHLLPVENFLGRPYKRSKYVTPPLSVKRDAPKPPFTDRQFHLYFDFNSGFIIYQFSDGLLDRAQFWIKHAKPTAIEIIGYGQIKPIHVSGKTLSEHASIGQRRAQRVRQSLIDYGIDEEIITTIWRENATPINDVNLLGGDDNSVRRVDISVRFDQKK